MCSVPGRMRSSSYRPVPVRSGWCAWRRGKAPMRSWGGVTEGSVYAAGARAKGRAERAELEVAICDLKRLIDSSGMRWRLRKWQAVVQRRAHLVRECGDAKGLDQVGLAEGETDAMVRHLGGAGP